DALIGAERPTHFHVRPTPNAGPAGPEMPGELHCRCSYSSRRAIDEYSFPALKFSSSEEIQRRRAAKRECGGFIAGEIDRFERHSPVFRHALVLRIATHAGAVKRKHLVTDFESGDVFPDGFNLPGEL